MTILKSSKNPPSLVINVTSATFALLGEKCLDWASAQKQISSLFNKMCALDIENIPVERVRILRREFTKKEEFNLS